MGTSLVKLQNIVMQADTDANISQYIRLLHDRAMIYDPKEKCHIIRQYDVVDFAMYINYLAVDKWKNFTYADNFKLKLTFKGKGVVEFTEYYRNSKNVNRNTILRMTINSKEKTDIVIDIPATDKPMVAFSLTALDDLRVYSGCYLAEVDDKNIRDVHLSLVSTTFKKEAYIKNNIRLLKENVLCKGSELKDHIIVNIIDNGRTLDKEALECKDLRIIPNNNVGGAGGFTRGMIESLALDPKPTHVLLMDDDVLIMCESLFRTYYLLRIVRPEHAKDFVSGAMFDYDMRERQYEDVGYVHKGDASYGPLKDTLDMNNVDSLLRNDKMSERKQKNSYAGWWYCCIPTELIEKNGLPLPVFVRGDDVEFSLRNKASFMTMNGICIWHVGFAGKFNAAMELYQVHRNSFVIQAASGICKDINFIRRLKILFWKELTRFAYNNAEQILDAVDDFMKGPGYLVKLNGEEAIKTHSAKNDKLIPISEFPAEYNISHGDPYSYKRLNKLQKLLYIVTLNGHLLPNIFLRRWPEVIAFDWFFVPGKNYRRRRLIAVNPNDQTACLREIDRKRCFELIDRYMTTMGNYRKNHTKVEKAYRKALKQMTSEKFWKEYLGI